MYYSRAETHNVSYIRPPLLHNWKPRIFIQNRPKHQRHQKRERHNRSVEYRVRSLKRLRPALQPCSPSPGVREGVQGAEEEVECQAPVGQVGEVGEGLPGGGGEVVGVVPAEDCEDGGEGVEGEEEAEGGEEVGSEEPGGCEAGCWIEGLGHAEEGVDLRHGEPPM